MSAATFFLMTAMLSIESCLSPSERAMPPAGRFVVKADKTLFYHIGPAQASGPDLQLFKDQQLTVIKRDFGYSQVVLDDGQSGYVPTEDIAPVLPKSTPKPTPKSRRSRGSSAPPLRDESQTPLPLPETPSPNFRF